MKNEPQKHWHWRTCFLTYTHSGELHAHTRTHTHTRRLRKTIDLFSMQTTRRRTQLHSRTFTQLCDERWHAGMVVNASVDTKKPQRISSIFHFVILLARCSCLRSHILWRRLKRAGLYVWTCVRRVCVCVCARQTRFPRVHNILQSLRI